MMYGHTCWPRQMRGPALKGRKMNGFGVRYLLTRSSRNRSGSYSCAVPLLARRLRGGHVKYSPSGPQYSSLRCMTHTE